MDGLRNGDRLKNAVQQVRLHGSVERPVPRALFYWLVVSCVTIYLPQVSIADNNTQRKLNFSKVHSLGSLLLLPPHKTTGTAGEQISGAKGEVIVNVPVTNLLIFEPNQYVFLHPELLDTASVAAVDALKISFLAMEPDEEKLCDKLLKHISRFSNVSILSVSDSDATDNGLKAAMTLPHVKQLIANRTGVKGQFLKNSGNLDNLKLLNLSQCPLDPATFKYFSKLKGLTKLVISKQPLDQGKLNDLSLCTNLTDLDIGHSGVDDACIKPILRLKKLQSLNLTDTSISLEGLKLLIPLKLKQLWLPKSFYTEKDKSFLTKNFGSAIQVSAINQNKLRDLGKILAPTSAPRSGR